MNYTYAILSIGNFEQNIFFFYKQHELILEVQKKQGWSSAFIVTIDAPCRRVRTPSYCFNNFYVIRTIIHLLFLI